MPGADYDLIWIQFAAQYLNDEQLITILKKCEDSLAEDGVVILKENCNDATTEVVKAVHEGME